MSTPAVARADLLDVELPKSVWAKSGRPLQGRLTRGLFASTLLLVGLALPWPAIGLSLAAAGLLGFVLFPFIVDALVQRLEGPILRATKEDAQARLDDLETRVLVTAFAADAWVTLQRGRLFLALGDGRSAAGAFADTARVLGDRSMAVMLSAQARALMLAGDRSQARTHLTALAEADELTARDHLDMGVVLLGEAARAAQAREHLTTAHEQLDGHPQASAALAISLARADQAKLTAEAMELLTKAEAEVDDDDVMGQALVKRARKALRPAREAAKKKRKKV